MDNPPAFQDKELMEKTIYLVNKYNVCKIYETGTFYGESTNILSNAFPDLKIYSYELIKDAYETASRRNARNKNVFIRNISSPEGLMKDMVEGEHNVLLFLDAHWYDYWPILDELSTIAKKGVRPCIEIHDFYVPTENGKSEIGYDAYNGQVLNFEYIEDRLKQIYGSEYEYEYSKNPILNAGVIYIYPR